MTFVIRRFHALFLRPFQPFRSQPEANWTEVKTEPSLNQIAKRRAWPPAAPKTDQKIDEAFGESTLVSARHPSTSEVRSRPIEVRECVIGVDDEEEETLDRDSSESGPNPSVEIGRINGGPWQDEPALRVDAKTPSSGAPFRPSRRYRAAAASRSAIRSMRAADHDTDETPACSSFDFPDHSAASGAIWPDDEEQAALSSRASSREPSREIAPSPTTPRLAPPVSLEAASPAPRISRRERALALTGELPVPTAQDLEHA
jgi:hypothetical protein